MHLDYEPLAPRQPDDPYPIYAALRAQPTLHRGPTSGVWCVARYDEVVSVLKQPERFSSRAMFSMLMNSGSESLPALTWGFARFLFTAVLRTRLNPLAFGRARQLIAEDPPVHGSLRGLVNRGFTPRRIQAWEPRVRELVADCMGRLRQGGDVDLIRDLAIPLPVTIIAEMLGVERERLDDFKRWSDAFIDGISGPGRGDRFSPELTEAFTGLTSYLRGVIAARRREPGDDLVSVLLAGAHDGSPPLSEIELILFVQLLLIAGNETTTNLIGNAVCALLDHPEVLAEVAADPGRVPGVVEETLRWESPIQLVFRSVRADTELGGTALPAGSVLALLLGSANRDEARFSDAARFDPERDARGHLGFGFGNHFCLGASLARLEAGAALEALAPALPRLERRSGTRELVDSFIVRGPARLRLRLAA